MSDKWARYDALVAGRVPTISLLNEPIDYSVDFVVAVKEETALDRAHRCWGMIPRNQGD